MESFVSIHSIDQFSSRRNCVYVEKTRVPDVSTSSQRDLHTLPLTIHPLYYSGKYSHFTHPFLTCFYSSAVITFQMGHYSKELMNVIFISLQYVFTFVCNAGTRHHGGDHEI